MNEYFEVRLGEDVLGLYDTWDKAKDAAIKARTSRADLPCLITEYKIKQVYVVEIAIREVNE